jgi:hypothetical protein
MTSLDLPPSYRLMRLREAGDAVAHARMHAMELGAGTLISVGRFDVAEFAVVLEPEEPLAMSWRALYAGMVALARAVAIIAPPATRIAIEWPNAIRVDGVVVGGGLLAWPEGAGDAVPPPWLVFGAIIRTTSVAGNAVVTSHLNVAPEDEGFGSIDADRLVESFARHLLRVVDIWRDTGFSAVADEYLSYLACDQGTRKAIGNNGDLRVSCAGKPVRRRLLTRKIVTPSWLETRGREPR